MNIGKSPDTVDEEQPSEEAMADHLGMDLPDNTRDAEQDASALTALKTDDAVNDDVLALLVRQQRQINDLMATVDRQQETIEHQQQRIVDLEERVDELETEFEEATDKRRDAFSLVNQAHQRIDAIEDSQSESESASESKPTIEPDAGHDDQETENETVSEMAASSPLDFFVNIQQTFVNDKLFANYARAVEIVRRHDEFAYQRPDGGIVIGKQEVRHGLTAILGETPHNETVRRVYENLKMMAGADGKIAKTRNNDRTGMTERGVKFAAETVARFEEGRYFGIELELLRETPDGRPQAGVTPVVIEQSAVGV